MDEKKSKVVVAPDDAERIRQVEDDEVVQWLSERASERKQTLVEHLESLAAHLESIVKGNTELDRAVAEAIGWTYTERVVVRNQFDKVIGRNLEGWWDGDEYVAYETPKFSVDLNAAFEAAEKVGLFPTDGMRFLRKEVDGLWVVVEVYTNSPYEAFIIGESHTPALAICAAILKLKTQP